MVDARENSNKAKRWLITIVECLALTSVFALIAGESVPDVNEAHYLCKAKQFWQPDWCQRDLFLASRPAHWLFFAVFGWPTQWVALPELAWSLRLLGWLGLSAGWLAISRTVFQTFGMGLLSGSLFGMLTEHVAMSGEWVIGGVESKVFAYVFVLFGLAMMMRNRWNWVWPLLGLAAGFHVLVGGWAVVAAGLSWLVASRERTPLKKMWLSLVIGFGLSLFGLLPALALSVTSDPKLVDRANQIYVMERLAHHLVYSEFSIAKVSAHVVSGLLMIGLAIACFRDLASRRIAVFAIGAGLIALVGIVITDVGERKEDVSFLAKWLRYYWFRLSDVAIPIALAVLIPKAWSIWMADSRKWRVWGVIGICGLMMIDGGGRIRRVIIDRPPPADRQSLGWGEGPQPEKLAIYQDWRDTCNWISENTPEGALFLTPRIQQTFKWYAGRAEVVNWKDVPQDAATLIEWRRRMDELYGFKILGVLNLTDEDLEKLIDDYRIDYLVVRRGDLELRRRIGFPVEFSVVYPEDQSEATFAVIDVRQTATDD